MDGEKSLQLGEHNEFAKRMDEANAELSRRINKNAADIAELQEWRKDIQGLIVSVNGLTIKLDALVETQSRQAEQTDSVGRKIGELSTQITNAMGVQTRQRERLDEHEERLGVLEGRDGEKWRGVVNAVLCAAGGGVGALIIERIFGGG